MAEQQGMSQALASRQRRSVISDAVSGIGMSRGPHVSIRGGRFRLIGANGAETLIDTHYLDLIFIDANNNTSKVFYEGTFDQNNMDQPPACFSDNGTGPSNQSMTPQSPTCAVCQWNVRGSETSFTGKPTKACSDRKKMAVIVPDDPQVNVYEIQIPPGSLTNLRAYSDWISRQASPVPERKMDIADFVTRVSFDPQKQFVMVFQAVAFADDDRTIQLIQYVDENKLSDVAVGRNDVAYNPAQVGQRPAPQQLPPPPAQALPASLSAPVAPQQFQVPQQPALPQAPPAAEPPAPPPGRRGRKPAQQPAPAAPTAAAPFMAPAATATAAATPPLSIPADVSIPSFLQRAPAQNGGAPAPTAAPPAPPPARFGIQAAGAPPPDVNAALQAAMQLPTRR